MAKIVDNDRARQGPRGRPVFLVLIGSFVLIGIYLISMLVWSGSDSPNSPSQDAARQQAGPASSSSSSTSSRTPPANPAYPAPSSPTATGTTGR